MSFPMWIHINSILNRRFFFASYYYLLLITPKSLRNSLSPLITQQTLTLQEKYYPQSFKPFLLDSHSIRLPRITKIPMTIYNLQKLLFLSLILSLLFETQLLLSTIINTSSQSPCSLKWRFGPFFSTKVSLNVIAVLKNEKNNKHLIFVLLICFFCGRYNFEFCIDSYAGKLIIRISLVLGFFFFFMAFVLFLFLRVDYSK